jgi:hypothetical protein
VVVVVVVVVVVATTPNYLRQASQNLGKYCFTQPGAFFCSIAQTAAHLIIPRLTFYIKYHSLLFLFSE